MEFCFFDLFIFKWRIMALQYYIDLCHFITRKLIRKLITMLASLVAQTVKRLPAMWETQVWSLGREDSLEEEMQPTPVPLPGKLHGQRSLLQATAPGVTKSRTRLSNFTFTFNHYVTHFSSNSSMISWLPYMFTHLFIFMDENTFVLSCFSHVWLFATRCTLAHQASLTVGFSR